MGGVVAGGVVAGGVVAGGVVAGGVVAGGVVAGGVVAGGVVAGGVVAGGVVAGGVVAGGVVAGGVVAGGVVAGGVVADDDPPVPGAPASDEGAPEPEAPPVDEVGVVGLPVEPPVAAVFDLLELPAEPPAPRGSTVTSELPSSCVPPEPAAPAQPIVRDAASGSSVARERERTLLCFNFRRDMSSGTGRDRTSDVCAVPAPQARGLSRRPDAEARRRSDAEARRRSNAEARRRSKQIAELGDLIVRALQPDLHALLFDARKCLR